MATSAGPVISKLANSRLAAAWATPTGRSLTVRVKAVERISSGTGAAATRVAACTAAGKASRERRSARKPGNKRDSGKRVGTDQCSAEQACGLVYRFVVKSMSDDRYGKFCIIRVANKIPFARLVFALAQ